jgi:hypothetical protein
MWLRVRQVDLNVEMCSFGVFGDRDEGGTVLFMQRAGDVVLRDFQKGAEFHRSIAS